MSKRNNSVDPNPRFIRRLMRSELIFELRPYFRRMASGLLTPADKKKIIALIQC